MAESLPIAQLGNPVLRQFAQPVERVQDEWVQSLIDNLMTTLVQSNGVGIAAPQVAASHRVLIVASRPNPRYPHAPNMEPTAMINPCLVSHSEEMVSDWEGCLSVPGIRGLVPRYQSVEIEYIDRHSKLQRQELTGFVARIVQHELDHLEGLIFLDRLTSVQNIVTDQEYFQRVLRQ